MLNIVSLLSGSSNMKNSFISVLNELRKWFEFFTAKSSPAISRNDSVGIKATW